MASKLEEQAARELTLKTRSHTTRMGQGFFGALYAPEEDAYPGKVLILVGGSDGSFSLTRLIGEQFVRRGLTVLSLAYWNQEGMEEAYDSIPLEVVERAAHWLHTKGYHRVGIWGISMGAEYALLCASYLPELITCAVAVNPLHVCGQAMQVRTEKVSKTGLLEGSAFSFRGHDIPWAPLRFDRKQIWRDSWALRGPDLRSCYAGVMTNPPVESLIPVEQISGPILLLSAGGDTMWNSGAAAKLLKKRLLEKRFPHAVEHWHYEYASLFLLPCRLRARRRFPVERRHPRECQASNEDAFEKTLAFLRRW